MRSGPYGWNYFDKVSFAILAFCIVIGVLSVYGALTYPKNPPDYMSDPRIKSIIENCSKPPVCEPK